MRFSGLLVILILVVSFDARANFYKYKDSNGAIVITDKLENVPQKYRKQFKVVRDAELEAKDSFARRKAAAIAAQEKREQEQAQEQRKAAEKKKSTNGKQL